MRDAQPRTIRLEDYRPPAFLIDYTDLCVQIEAGQTRVHARLALRRNPAAPATGPLVLNGNGLTLESLRLDGRKLVASEYRCDADTLVIDDLPQSCVLESTTLIHPESNTTLEGLYRSSSMYCTQCEAEGFRSITWYLDRPDVLSVYRVRIEADRAECPVLLSNGNCVAAGELEGGRHYAEWQDPFPKPSYLFALVAGDLVNIEDRFTTASGRDVTLRIFVEPKDLDKCDYAMDALKRAMRWDEEVYGREYDLDIFNIVAVDDFNMGAMENKSLNIFNTSCVLARPDTTTDAGFQRVEAVVAHEYFHNWSGNRVTCRDWFQLSLKEGFTVFRDAEFSADMGSRTVKRIEDVQLLRTLQFAEDSGPMAHPVRPDAYMEISNFYTVTIYEKGAEVVRMLHNLLGAERFRQGSDLYFERFDGQAVTCDDFVQCMAEVSGRNLDQFKRWYSQAGTPQLDVRGDYDAEARTFTLTVGQSCPPTPGQPVKAPFHIPLAMALLGEAGALRLELDGVDADPDTNDNTQLVLDVTEAEQRFVFNNINEAPVPSLLRGFSAPVKLDYPYTRQQLGFLLSRDDDGFCRWDAGQQLACLALDDLAEAWRAGQPMTLAPELIDGLSVLLEDDSLDPAMVALMLTLPSESYLAERAGRADVDAIHAAREFARRGIAEALEGALWRRYRSLERQGPYQANARQIADRSLRNTCLGYLLELPDTGLHSGASGDSVVAVPAPRPEYQAAAERQFAEGDNMTDVLAGLTLLVNCGGTAGDRALASFYQRWQDEALVVNQWFQVQASCKREGALERVQGLLLHPAYDARNPNKIRAVVGAFCQGNPYHFHRIDGEGYRFLADQVAALNHSNPQIAARLLSPLTRWRGYLEPRAGLMRAELERLAGMELSADVYEVVAKSLQA